MAWIVESAVTAVMLMAVTLQLDTAAVLQAGQVSCVSVSLLKDKYAGYTLICTCNDITLMCLL